MAEDYLRSLPEPQVAAWYRRLADRIAREQINKKEPLASILLRHWLDNRDSTSTFTFTAPEHLQNSSYVTEVLRYHRAVFLTEKEARIGGKYRWAGVVPRIQGATGFARWDMSHPLDLEYESLVEVGNGYIDLLRIQRGGTPEERDLLTSLRGFQLRSRVTVTATQMPDKPSHVKILFKPWRARVRDRYDWDYSEHFTVPNPDFGSTQSGAVKPKEKMLTVFHSNAKRLEDAKLAAPYDLQTDEWGILDNGLIGEATVDTKKKI